MFGSIFNSHLPISDIIVLLLNIICICYAIYWNIKAARQGIHSLTKLRARIAALAIVFLMSYIGLTFLNIDPGAWSGVMRYFGPITWVLVWAEQCRLSLSAQSRLPDALVNEILRKMGIEEKDGNEE